MCYGGEENCKGHYDLGYSWDLYALVNKLSCYTTALSHKAGDTGLSTFNGTHELWHYQAHDVIRCPSSLPLKNREGWDSPNSIFTDFSLVVLFQSKINLNFVESVPKLQCWKYLLIFSGSFSSSHFYERSTSKVDKRKQDAISKVDKKRQDIEKTLNRRKKSSEHFSDENDSQHSRYISNFYTRHYNGDLNTKLVQYLNSRK